MNKVYFFHALYLLAFGVFGWRLLPLFSKRSVFFLNTD